MIAHFAVPEKSMRLLKKNWSDNLCKRVSWLTWITVAFTGSSGRGTRVTYQGFNLLSSNNKFDRQTIDAMRWHELVYDMNRCEESRMLKTDISLFWYYSHKEDECSFFMNSIFLKISSLEIFSELEIWRSNAINFFLIGLSKSFSL